MAVESVSSGGSIQMKLNPLIECTLRDATNCQMAGDYQLARALFDQILEAEPDNVNALIGKGNVYDLQGNYSGALECYNSAIECDPYNAEAWYARGVTLKKTGAVEEGLNNIQKGISLSIGDI
jgi:tetratricopeptide (TPR) repeat protein